MDALRIEQTDDSPEVIMDQQGNRFEIFGKSLPEDVVDFYQPVLDWLNEYRKKPNSKTEFNIKLIYFNTASSKLILDILMIFEEMVEEDHEILINWLSLKSDEDMQEAGREYEEMIDVHRIDSPSCVREIVADEAVVRAGEVVNVCTVKAIGSIVVLNHIVA